LAALTLLADLALALPATRYGAAFALLWLLPGLAWASLLADRHHQTSAEDIAVGLGLGTSTTALLTLLLHYIPGPLTLPVLLIAVNVSIFAPLLVISRHPSPDPRFSMLHSPFSHLSFVILIAAFFRLLYLGYSEFQGDEGIVMIRAARATLGDEAQLFYHQKGPAEVLLPMVTWTLSGTINEWQARLPFAYAGVLGVVALYLLGRQWFNGRTAFVAALLLAINGYFVGFGRIVQYQSLVLATTTLALLALWRWSEGEGRRWLVAGAALLAFSLLAHYDAGLALPAAAYVVGRRLWVVRSQWRVWLKDLLGAGALAGGILALFYVPFALHPNFAKTLGYLGGARIGTGGPLYNNLLSSLPLATFYNSIYYLVGLACLLVVASFLSFRRLGISVALHTAWLWFGVPFLFYYFLVWDPRTHVLNVFPGAILLAAVALDYLVNLVPSSTRHCSSSTGRRSLFIVHCSLFVVFLFLAYYPYLMFIQHNPEIKRTWPAHQPVLYWKPGDEIPLFGYFGFPYRAGWKVIGTLVEEGILSGVYASNEEQEITNWYVRGAERTVCPDPEWYLIAKNVQDEVPIQQTDIETAYHLWGEIRVAGEPKLWIYRRGPSVAVPAIYHVEDYAPRFDARTTLANAIPRPPANYTPADYTLGDKVRLLGYRLEDVEARPGGSIYLVLYWEALQPMKTNYQVFNHLYDGTMWGQQDGTPGCASLPTVLWEPGQIVRDEYTIPIAPSTPVGDIPLRVGMYDLVTRERLPVRGLDDVPIGDAIPLTTVAVR